MTRTPTPAAVGFGLPSQIDQRHGRVLDSTNVPLEDIDFKDEMARRLGVPVEIDNDANVACLAEVRDRRGRGLSHVVMLTLGTGVGGGIVLDGEMYRGSIGAGGELGHMSIDEDGPPCQGHCPNRGCLEVLASAIGVMAAAERSPTSGPHGGLWPAARAAATLDGAPRDRPRPGRRRGGASTCSRMVGRHLGVGIANYVNIFNPELVVIGGGISAAGELLLAPAREEYQRAGCCAARRAKPWSLPSSATTPACWAPRRWCCSGGERPGALVVCPTPIGNLGDVTLRVLEELRAGRLRSPARTPAARARCSSRHGIHAAAARAARAQRARADRRAGARGSAPATASACSPTPACRPCPTPARVLVSAVIAAGLAVEVLPGASAVTTALVASGFAGGGFVFAGFLPRTAGALDAAARAGSTPPGWRWSRSSRRDGCRRRWRRWPRATRERRDGGLPRADQAARAGRAGHARPSWPSASPSRPGAR